jgi:hypothetical protein
MIKLKTKNTTLSEHIQKSIYKIIGRGKMDTPTHKDMIANFEKEARTESILPLPMILYIDFWICSDSVVFFVFNLIIFSPDSYWWI